MERGGADEGGEGEKGRERVAGARQAAGHAAGVPEQGGGADLLGAGERQEGEEERGEGAVERGFGQGAGIDGELGRDGERRLDDGGEEERQDCAEEEAEGDAGGGEGADLHQIGEEHGGALGPQRAEGGDGGGLAREVGAHGRRDADAADGEAGEADEDQKGGELLGEALHPGRAGASVAPAGGVADGALGLGLGGGEARALGEIQAVMGVEQGARGEEAGAFQVLPQHDGARAEPEAAAGRVGLGGDAGGEDEATLAQGEGVAGGEGEAGHQGALHHRAGEGRRCRRGPRPAASGGRGPRGPRGGRGRPPP